MFGRARRALETPPCRKRVVLDPVYIGKAMSGLIDWIGEGCFTACHVVVFLHTGGVPDSPPMRRSKPSSSSSREAANDKRRSIASPLVGTGWC